MLDVRPPIQRGANSRKQATTSLLRYDEHPAGNSENNANERVGLTGATVATLIVTFATHTLTRINREADERNDDIHVHACYAVNIVGIVIAGLTRSNSATTIYT